MNILIHRLVDTQDLGFCVCLFHGDTSMLMSTEQKKLWNLESRWRSRGCQHIKKNQNLTWQWGKAKKHPVFIMELQSRESQKL